METLRKVAAGLKRLAQERPGVWIRHTFTGGLRVAIRWNVQGEQESWQLYLMRENATPGEIERQLCRKAFGAPVNRTESGTINVDDRTIYFYLWTPEMERQAVEQQPLAI